MFKFVNRLFLACLFFFLFILLNNLFFIQHIYAIDPSFHTGYYIGNGVSGRGVSGLPFDPDVVIIKSMKGTGLPVFKGDFMADATTAFLSATADSATTEVTLTSDGFTVNTTADVNESGAIYQYLAIGGNDCTSSGYVCVGTFTGDGTSDRLITTGFQPDNVIVKRSTSANATLRTSDMMDNNGANFSTGGLTIDGTMFTTLDSTGFRIGTTNNSNGGTFYYIALKNHASYVANGSYMGDASDDRAITGAGFQPDFVLIKNVDAVSTGDRRVRALFRESYGDMTSSLNHAVDNAANIIQSLDSDGFTVGSSNVSNGSTNNIYWVALGGATDPSGSGAFTVSSGSYTGTGSSLAVTGVGFKPDLVIIKQAGTQVAYFAHMLMPSGVTSALGSVTSDITDGITSFDNDGFTVGVNANLNTASSTYYYQAYANAFNPHENSGSTDFAIGAYYGNAVDSRDIKPLSNSFDFVTVKRSGASGATWFTTSMSADSSATFTNGSQLTNNIQALGTNSFQVGTDSRVNNNLSHYWFFAFNSGNNFSVGSFTGSGSSSSVTSLVYQPEVVWLKGSGGTYALHKTAVNSGDSTGYFDALDFTTNHITSLLKNGFGLGTSNDANKSATTHYWATWDSKVYAQVGFRFFASTGTTDVGAALAAEDTAASLSAPNDSFRLRLLLNVDDGNMYSGAGSFKLQYVDKGSGTCASPTGGTPASYTDVSDSTLIAFDTAAGATDKAALTGNANDPERDGVTSVDQSFNKSNTFTNNQAAVTIGRDGMWDFALKDNGATANTTFCFRAVNEVDGSVLDTYSVYPSVTTANVVISISLDTDGTVSYGYVPLNTSKSTIDLSDTQTVSNDSTVAVDLNIKSSNATGGTAWTLASTTASDQYMHEFSINNGGAWTALTTPDQYQTLTTNVAVSGTQSFDLRLTTPTATTDYNQKTATVTIQAVEN